MSCASSTARYPPTYAHSSHYIYQEKNTYVVHDESAKMIAEQYNKTTSTLKMLAWPGRATPMPTQGVSHLQFRDTILPDLLCRRCYRIEVYTREGNEWSLSKQGSPGNVGDFEELLSSSDPTLTPVMAAIRISLDMGNRVRSVDNRSPQS